MDSSFKGCGTGGGRIEGGGGGGEVDIIKAIRN